MLVRICSTLIEPREVLVPSSSQDRLYNVSAPTIFNEAVCECPGYIYRGKCRHVDWVYANDTCDWVSAAEGDRQTQLCPKCGRPAMDWETDPVYT